MREIYDDQFRQHVLRFQALDRQATQMADQSAQRVSELSVSARFDLERTRIAYEQLMMSWIRTATSLITFGFSIYNFFVSIRFFLIPHVCRRFCLNEFVDLVFVPIS